ncbi:retrovirus-related pol polyprotein from transposon TNT 1-94 [Tanacetum coccineum]
MKPKKLGSNERLASPKPSKPRSCLRWSPTVRLFDLKGKIIASSKSECQSDCSNGDNACTSNPQEPTIKQFPNSTSFLGRSKDEAPEVIKTFLKRITVLLQSPVIIIRTDNGTEFKNQILKECFDKIATACYTQTYSIIHRRFNKTSYELINGRKPDISFLRVFGALWYPKNEREDIGKLGAKGDIGFFIGYSADSCAYKVYNKRTKKIIETMNVTFDELSAMAFEQSSSKPGLQGMTSRHISSGLDLTYAPSTITTQQPTEGELDLLFEAVYDDHIGGQPSAALRTILAAQAP